MNLWRYAVIGLLMLSVFSCDRQRMVETGDAPAAIGPYSQAVRHGNTLFLSGQIALDPRNGQLVAGVITEQTEQALNNCHAVLQAAGFGKQHVVQVQVFLTDLEDYSRMNDVYAAYFDTHKPARAVVEVSRLPRDAAVEIMMTAVK